MSQSGRNSLVQVHNTFLEATNVSEEESLPRTMSDTTHSRGKLASPGLRIDAIREESSMQSSLSPANRMNEVSVPLPILQEEDLQAIYGTPMLTQEEYRRFFEQNIIMPMEPDHNSYNYRHRSHDGTPSGHSRTVPMNRRSAPVVGTELFDESHLTKTRWHEAIGSMGLLSADGRSFEKTEFEGRLSMITENVVRTNGSFKFAALIEGSSISAADGVGFVFGDRLPFRRNIQLIDSVFINKKGQVCVRSQQQLVNVQNSFAASLELGRIVQVNINLDNSTAVFSVYSGREGACVGRAEINFADSFKGERTGFFCAVVKNTGTKISLLG